VVDRNHDREGKDENYGQEVQQGNGNGYNMQICDNNIMGLRDEGMTELGSMSATWEEGKGYAYNCWLNEAMRQRSPTSS